MVEEFAAAPRAFLAKYAIVVDEDGVISHERFREWRNDPGLTLDRATFPSAPGVYRFTLVKAFNNVVLLRPHDGSGKGMRAYWLPWQSGGVTSCELGSEAPLFFTSQLTGCRLSALVDSNDPNKAKVSHLAGNMARGAVDRNKAEKAELGPPKLVRRLSQGNIDPSNAYKPNHSAFVIGYNGGKGWKFCAQVVKGGSTAYEVKLDGNVEVVQPMQSIV
jgi:hypothetical protein